MHHPDEFTHVHLVTFILTAGLLAGCATGSSARDQGANSTCERRQIDKYEQSVRIASDGRTLEATSRIRLCPAGRTLTLFLADGLDITSATVDGQPVDAKRTEERLSDAERAIARRIELPDESSGAVTLVVEYGGPLNTKGTSGDRIRLAADTAWSPVFEAAESFTAKVTVDLPSDYAVASRGRGTGRETGDGRRRQTWETTDAGRDLGIAAAPSRTLLLNRHAIDMLADAARESLADSSLHGQWASADADGQRRRVTMLAFRNATDRSVGSALAALASKLETVLVNDVPVDVLRPANRTNLVATIEQKYPDADPTTLTARYGRQVGADYVVTGRIRAEEALSEPPLAVTYAFDARIVEVATGNVVFSEETGVTVRVDDVATAQP